MPSPPALPAQLELLAQFTPPGTAGGGNTTKRSQNEGPRTRRVEPTQENPHMGGVGIGDMQLAAKYLSIAPWAVGNGGVLSLTFFTFSFLAYRRI